MGVEVMLLSKDVKVVYEILICDSHHIYLIHCIFSSILNPFLSLSILLSLSQLLMCS